MVRYTTAVVWIGVNSNAVTGACCRRLRYRQSNAVSDSDCGVQIISSFELRCILRAIIIASAVDTLMAAIAIMVRLPISPLDDDVVDSGVVVSFCFRGIKSRS